MTRAFTALLLVVFMLLSSCASTVKSPDRFHTYQITILETVDAAQVCSNAAGRLASACAIQYEAPTSCLIIMHPKDIEDNFALLGHEVKHCIDYSWLHD